MISFVATSLSTITSGAQFEPFRRLFAPTLLLALLSCVVQTSSVAADDARRDKQESDLRESLFEVVGREVLPVPSSRSLTSVDGAVHNFVVPIGTLLEQSLISHSLMITDPLVVDDARAKEAGPWSFAAMMRAIANEPVTGISPAEMATRWIDAYDGLGSSNGSFSKRVRDTWKELSNGSMEVQHLPFRLLAIVNRLDLRNNRVLTDAPLMGKSAGEIRFVYCLINGKGEPERATVIFEYSVIRRSFPGVRRWAGQWHKLSDLQLGTPQYLHRLEQLTAKAIAPNAIGTNPPSYTTLSQLRVNEGFTSKSWFFTEFRPSSFDTGYLHHVTSKQTPIGTTINSKTINDFLGASKSDILAKRHQVPVYFQGEEFLARVAMNENADAKSFFWNGENLPSDLLQARHLFSLNTCNACHGAETGMADFFHVSPRKSGSSTLLSAFLLGVDVKDPAEQTYPHSKDIVTRHFADLSVRAHDLHSLVTLGKSYETRRPPTTFVH